MIPLIILFKVLFFYIQLKSDFSNYHGTKKIALKNGGFKKSKYSDKKVGLIFKNPKYKCCTFFQQNYSVSQVLKKLGIVLCFLRDGDISNSLSCTLSFRYCLAMFLFGKEQNFKSSVLPQITLFRLAAFSLLIPFSLLTPSVDLSSNHFTIIVTSILNGDLVQQFFIIL